MKAAIFMGSPRKKGNTAQCLTPFCEELSRSGAAYTVTWLYDMYRLSRLSKGLVRV